MGAVRVYPIHIPDTLVVSLASLGYRQIVINVGGMRLGEAV